MPYNTRSRQHSEAHQSEEEHAYPSKRGRKANGKGARSRSSSEERKTSNADQQSRSRSKERRSRSTSRERRGRSRSKSPSTNRARQESGGGRPRSRSRSKEREKDVNHHPVKQEEGEGESQAMDTSGSDKDTGVDLEHGHIYFFYRPKLKTNEKESESESSKDVQRLFMLLIPHHVKSSEHKEKRIPSLIIIGSKKLPLIQSHEKHWGFVAAASENYHELLKDFKEHTYETKTRGERTVKAIRILGIGAYSISHHQQKRSSYLSYILTDPDPPADVQEDFNLEHEGTFAISVKNPKGTSSTATDGGGGGNDENNADDTTTSSTSSSKKFNKDPNFPDYLQKQFRDLSFLQLTETTLFLNHPNCQILLVGTRNSIDVDELGKDAVQALNLIVGSIKQKATTTVIDEDLQINLSDYNIEPLKGRWPEKNS